jgi:hypothetical protein
MGVCHATAPVVEGIRPPGSRHPHCIPTSDSRGCVIDQQLPELSPVKALSVEVRCPARSPGVGWPRRRRMIEAVVERCVGIDAARSSCWFMLTDAANDKPRTRIKKFGILQLLPKCHPTASISL